MTFEPSLPDTVKTVLRFLESVGRPSEAELYLKLFRRIPKESFALVVPQTAVVREGLGALADQMGFLSRLGLVAPVVLGVFDGDATEEDRDAVIEALNDVGVRARREAATTDREAVRRALRADESPVFLAREPEGDQLLVDLVSSLGTRKLVHLRDQGGLGPHGVWRIELSPGHVMEGHGSGVGVINLRSDFAALTASTHLSPADSALLARVRALLERLTEREGASHGPQGTMVSVASPLSLLKELFTVRGAGTLIKRGAAVFTHDGYEGVDLPKTRQLLESAFSRVLAPGFEERSPLRVYREADYRGIAILEAGVSGAYLSKFAVQAVARGEGLGQDLWWALVREHPSVYWRSRPDNPINPWYQTVCDGMQRGERWHVFWRGIEADRLEAVLRDAEGRPADFLPNP